MPAACQLLLNDVDETRALGRDIAEALDCGAVIALSGNLGAGKTTLVQSIGKALGVSEVISSPTFTMMNEYHSGRLSLYHFDFYRVMEMAERQQEDLSLDLVATEFDEISDYRGAVMVVEWPEYFLVEGATYLDSIDHLHLSIKTNEAADATDDQRVVEMKAIGPNSAELLAKLMGRHQEAV